MELQNDIMEYFPKGYTPRKAQTEVLRKIQPALQANQKFIIVNAPVGSGKSHISATLANLIPDPDPEFVRLVDAHEIAARGDGDKYIYEDWANDLDPFGCYVLTTTKNLQNQYDTSFPDSRILKGKRNYQCQVDTDFDCELAPCVTNPALLNQCLQAARCPYYEAQREAWGRKFAVLSYSKFFQLPNFLKRRAIIICDEASELEDEIVSQFTATIEYPKLAKEGIKVPKLVDDDRTKIYGWMADLLIELKHKKKVLYEKVFKAGKKRSSQVVNTIKLKYISRLLESLVLVNNNWENVEFLIERDESKITFIPLHINKLTEHIFKYSNHIVFLSATIIDHKTFAETLGIPNNYCYIEVDSVFDPKKSPIYCPGKYSLSYKNIDANLPKVVDQALKICDFYKGKCGIIHTYNFKITNAIQQKVGLNRRFLIRERGIANERLVLEHMNRKDGTVLVSPSLAIGTNLIDDLGRFQIIMKLPYPPLSSLRIKTLLQKNYRWYQAKMLTALVQAAGRCTRSTEDHSTTFILDGAAFEILKRNYNILPKDFVDRLV